MSDVDGSILRLNHDGLRLLKIEIRGKLDDQEWEVFKQCIKEFVKAFKFKLSIQFS